MQEQQLVLAVDIGGTKLAVGVVDEEGRVLESRRAPNPNPPTGDGEALLRALLALIDELATDRAALTGVGIGCGGPMRWPAGEVSPLNIPSWRDFPLRARLAEELKLPVRIHNDAICVAIAEHWRGAGVGADNVLGMVVSTGVGGGLILGGRLIDGASGNAGNPTAASSFPATSASFESTRNVTVPYRSYIVLTHATTAPGSSRAGTTSTSDSPIEIFSTACSNGYACGSLSRIESTRSSSDPDSDKIRSTSGR